MTCNNIVFEQLTLQGSQGLTNHNTIDIEECANFCNFNPRCNSYIFDFSIRECHTSALTPKEYSQYSRYMGGPRECAWQWNDCVRPNLNQNIINSVVTTEDLFFTHTTTTLQKLEKNTIIVRHNYFY